MRALYLSDGIGIHDERFVAALREEGHAVGVAVPGPGDSWILDGAPRSTDEVLAQGWDVGQVGPLEAARHFLPLVGRLPLVATCWGSEAFRVDPPATRGLLEGAVAVLADCRAVADRLVALGAPSDRLVRFAWGIDLGRFRPPALPAGRQDHRLVVTTRAWDVFYRHDVVLEGLRRAVDTGADDLRLRMLGAGPAEGELRQLVVDLDLADRVSLEPPVTEAALADILGSATAWVNAAPSDGTCISLLQALACGADVITADVPCAREASGPTAVSFFPVDDSAGLARALGRAARASTDALRVRTAWLESFADWRTNRRIYVGAMEAAAR